MRRAVPAISAGSAGSWHAIGTRVAWLTSLSGGTGRPLIRRARVHLGAGRAVTLHRRALILSGSFCGHLGRDIWPPRQPSDAGRAPKDGRELSPLRKGRSQRQIGADQKVGVGAVYRLAKRAPPVNPPALFFSPTVGRHVRATGPDQNNGTPQRWAKKPANPLSEARGEQRKAVFFFVRD